MHKRTAKNDFLSGIEYLLITNLKFKKNERKKFFDGAFRTRGFAAG